MSKITTCLWFDGKADEAARFYVSLLPESRIGAVVPYSVEPRLDASRKRCWEW